MDTVRIMLVDDHKMIREGIKTYLAEDESYKIVGEAENGIDCLEQLESLEVDLVLSDLNMPEMDGLELAKELKSKFPDIKLIALTMMGESQHIKQMLAEG
ncbi:MAG: response regulator transcription factor, partial [Roseivirga sp.]|nr:response regulator transcription factor [Roseivirga sp.]